MNKTNIVFSVAIALALTLNWQPVNAFQFDQRNIPSAQSPDDNERHEQLRLRELSLVRQSQAQEAELRARSHNDGPDMVRRYQEGMSRYQEGHPGPGNNDPFSAATQKLKSAESDSDRETAMEAIRMELDKQYDGFLAANEKQIEELQDRLDKLKEQLVRRREAKEKMIDLELERVVNESEGLIWPNRGSRDGMFSEFPPGPAGFFDTPAGPRGSHPFPAIAPMPDVPVITPPSGRTR